MWISRLKGERVKGGRKTGNHSTRRVDLRRLCSQEKIQHFCSVHNKLTKQVEF